MVWRRGKIAELKDPLLFKQEYPATAQEAFQLTGHDSFIKSEAVLAARKATCEGIGPLVIGADPARFGMIGSRWHGEKAVRFQRSKADRSLMLFQARTGSSKLSTLTAQLAFLWTLAVLALALWIFCIAGAVSILRRLHRSTSAPSRKSL
jgi:hypothetical protein